MIDHGVKRPPMRKRRKHSHHFQRIVGDPFRATLEACVHCGMLRVTLFRPEGRDPQSIPGNVVCFDYALKPGDD